MVVAFAEKRLSKSGGGKIKSLFRIAKRTRCQHLSASWGTNSEPPRTSQQYGAAGFEENPHFRSHYTEGQHQMKKNSVTTFPCRSTGIFGCNSSKLPSNLEMIQDLISSCKLRPRTCCFILNLYYFLFKVKNAKCIQGCVPLYKNYKITRIILIQLLYQLLEQSKFGTVTGMILSFDYFSRKDIKTELNRSQFPVKTYLQFRNGLLRSQ